MYMYTKIQIRDTQQNIKLCSLVESWAEQSRERKGDVGAEGGGGGDRVHSLGQVAEFVPNE